MNESELKTYCLEHAGETLTAEAEALLKRDPELKRQVDRLITVRKIISLKRFEQPHSACTERCIRAVTARIEKHHNRGILVKVRDWFVMEQPVGNMAYAAAALVVCLVGAGVYVRGSVEVTTVAVVEETAVQPQAVTQPVLVSAEVAAPAEEEVIREAFAGSIPSFDKPLIILQVSSNPQPSTPRMSFGNGASVPVSFEY